MTDRLNGICGMQSYRGALMAALPAAWPLVALKLRIKGYRKLLGLILDWHVDRFG